MIFLDTGYHFAETIGTRDWITGVLPVTLVNVSRRRAWPSRTWSTARGSTSATLTSAARCGR